MSLMPRGKKEWFPWDVPGLFKNFSEKLPTFFEAGALEGLSISSDENKVYVEAAVPGLTGADIDVSLDEDGLLWIKGEKKEETTKDRKYYHRSQKNYSYCLSLGNEVDLSQEPEAVCKDGIMKLAFNKRKENKTPSRKIKVK